MTPQDLRILCTALGFTAVVMQGKNISKKDTALRATGFANLIEEFCHTALPDIFNADGMKSIADEEPIGDPSPYCPMPEREHSQKFHIKSKP